MKFKNRIAKLAAKLDKAVPEADPRQKMLDRWREQWQEEEAAKMAAFLARVPADLREAVASLLKDERTRERLSGWMLWPFARWATPPADWTFPRALVELWVNPPRDYWAGHHCGSCGLTVGLYVYDGTPGDITIFARCPACGGRTSFMAHYEPDPQPEAATCEP